MESLWNCPNHTHFCNQLVQKIIPGYTLMSHSHYSKNKNKTKHGNLWLVKISGCSNQLQVVFFLTDVCRFADKCCVASNWRQMPTRHSEWIMSTTLWSRESTQLVTSWLCSGYFPVWKQSCKRSPSCRNHIYNVEEFLNFSDLRWEFLSVDGSKFRYDFLWLNWKRHLYTVS